MTHATRTRPARSPAAARGAGSAGGVLVVVRRIGARFALALCAALLAAVGLGGVAAPALGATATGPWPAGAGQSGSGGAPLGHGPTGGGYGAAPTPATARAVGLGVLSGTANRVRPNAVHENSKPVLATAQRGPLDGLPAAVAVARLGLTEPLFPAGRALTSAPSRAPPVPTGLPDTRAPPPSGPI